MKDVLGEGTVRFNDRLRALWETRPEEMRQRVRTSLMLAPAVLAVVAIGGVWFNIMVLAAAVLMAFEWKTMTDNINDEEIVQKSWMWRGVAYIALGAGSLLWLRQLNVLEDGYNGATVLIWVLCVVWATDIAAYFSGRAIGGPKLAPAISPGKTWAGLLGGMAAAAVIGGFFAIFKHMPSFVGLFFLSALIAAVAQGGDLLESWIKRQCGVKDSGDLIPGHGGILDRVDGFVTAAPFVVILLTLIGRP